MAKGKKLSLEWRQTASEHNVDRKSFYSQPLNVTLGGSVVSLFASPPFSGKAHRVAGQFYISMSFYHCAKNEEAEKATEKGLQDKVEQHA
jgi:hypothetical protein